MKLKASGFLLEKVFGVVSYLYGKDFAEASLDGDIEVEVSPRTGRIRHVYVNGALAYTVRASDGYFLFTVHTAKLVYEVKGVRKWFVKVREDAAPYIAEGRTVFAKHVVDVYPEVRAGTHVMVVSESDKVVAVGRAALSAEEMLSFNTGIAVKVKSGIKSEKRSKSR